MQHESRVSHSSGLGTLGARAATDLKRQGYHTRPVRIEARQVASRFAREARRRPSFPAVLKDAFFESSVVVSKECSI